MIDLRLSRLAFAAPLALLAGCGDKAPADDDGRAATGEVLEGTISDAMLPTARVRSQAPLAGPEATGTGEGGGGAAAPGAEEEATPAAEGETPPAEAVTPAAELTPAAAAN